MGTSTSTSTTSLATTTAPATTTPPMTTTSAFARSHYGPPPCLSDEVEVILKDGFSVCTSNCVGSSADNCPKDLPGHAQGFRHKGAQCGVFGSKVDGLCYLPCDLDSDCDKDGGASCLLRHPLGTCGYPKSNAASNWIFQAVV